MKNYNRKKAINYIRANFTNAGKKITKKELEAKSDLQLQSIIIVNKCEEKYDKWVDPATLTKYFVQGVDNDKDYTYETYGKSREDVKRKFRSEGINVVQIIEARGRHICKYCGNVVDGTDKNVLCCECSDEFGHYLYSEL